MKIRVGFGYDVHKLKENLDLYIGGIKIHSKKGALAHSDGDVLIHAICDALIGAACLGDIGKHFSDTSKKYKNIDSKILLKNTLDLIRLKGYKAGNIDCTVCLQSPKIGKYIPEMQKILSDIIQIGINDINIKATTTERLGFVGNEEGISAYAVTLIEKV